MWGVGTHQDSYTGNISHPRATSSSSPQLLRRDFRQTLSKNESQECYACAPKIHDCPQIKFTETKIHDDTESTPRTVEWNSQEYPPSRETARHLGLLFKKNRDREKATSLCFCYCCLLVFFLFYCFILTFLVQIFSTSNLTGDLKTTGNYIHGEASRSGSFGWESTSQSELNSQIIATLRNSWKRELLLFKRSLFDPTQNWPTMKVSFLGPVPIGLFV